MTRWTTLILLLFTTAACGRGDREADGTISRARFVETNVALRLVERSDSAADSLRLAVLQDRGVTEEDLRGFVAARSGRPAVLAAVWEEIHQGLVSVRDEREAEREAEAASIEGADTAVSAPDTAVAAEPPPLRTPGRTTPRIGRASEIEIH